MWWQTSSPGWARYFRQNGLSFQRFSVYMHQVALTSNRPFCNEFQQVATVCVTSSGIFCCAVDPVRLPWEDLDPHAFPPTAILDKVVMKLRIYPCKRIILIASGWPNIPWFWDLVGMVSQTSLCLPNLLIQPFKLHTGIGPILISMHDS